VSRARLPCPPRVVLMNLGVEARGEYKHINGKQNATCQAFKVVGSRRPQLQLGWKKHVCNLGLSPRTLHRIFEEKGGA
jgi:hypothetical protein